MDCENMVVFTTYSNNKTGYLSITEYSTQYLPVLCVHIVDA
jgi:hypothetical protein